MSVLRASILYVGGAAAGTLCSQLAVYMGLGNSRTGLTVFCFYLGWLFSSWSVTKEKEKIALSAKQIIYLGVFAALRLSGTAVSFVAIDYAGSSVFQLVYSTVPVFAAIAGKIFFGKNLYFEGSGGPKTSQISTNIASKLLPPASSTPNST